MQILFDISRLMHRGLDRTPTGIDRVDLAYAAHLGNNACDISYCYSTSRPRILRPAEAAIFARRPALQIDTPIDRNEPHFEELCALLAKPPKAWGKAAGAVRLAGKAPRQSTFAALLSDAFKHKPRGRSLPPDLNGTIYLHTSHSGLEKPGVLEEIKMRGGRVAVMVHDLIPLDYPEYCRPHSAEQHQHRLLSIQKRADLILANSSYTLRRLEAWAQANGLTLPPARVVPLGVFPRYLSRAGLRPPTGARDYFVMAGTISARKNHAFMLTIWRRLAEQLGEKCPVLVIAGRRGWEMEAAADLMDRCPALAGHVVEVSQLDDFSLASLMAGAQAVLQPSLVEGFSLPVAEAQSLGVPVIASDIDVHREIAAPGTVLVDPLDGPEWLSLIKARVGGHGSQVRHSWRALDQRDHVASAVEAMRCLQ